MAAMRRPWRRGDSASGDRKSTRLNSSHLGISYAVFCLKKREWLASNNGKAHELWVGFYKKKLGKGGISYPEAFDEALFFFYNAGTKKVLHFFRYPPLST